MAEAQYKDLILETIDSLRKRKARPDLERICHMVERRYGITLEESQADLEKLVQAKIVIKVDYKGSTSYRNAAKWRKSHLVGQVANPSETSGKLLTCIGVLLTELEAMKIGSGEDRQQEPTSVSVAQIERRLLEEDPTTNINDLNLQQQINNEVEAGRLVRLPTGNYVLGEAKSTPSTINTSGTTSPSKKGRPTSTTKRKIRHISKGSKEPKVKKLSISSFDEADFAGHSDERFTAGQPIIISPQPDDPDVQLHSESDFQYLHQHHHHHHLQQVPIGLPPLAPPPLPPPPPPPPTAHHHHHHHPSASSASTSSSNPSPIPYKLSSQISTNMGYGYVENGESRCDYCLLTSECNRKGRPEELLICKDCQAKAHPSCMDYSEDLAKRARNSPWQCIDCKTCYVCEDSGDPDAMLFCDACDKGYHMNCHNPPILDKPTGKWVCSKCVLELGLENEQDLDTMEANDNEVGQANGHADNNNTSNINKNTDGGGASCLPTPCDSPVHFQDGPEAKDPSDNRDQRASLMLKMPGYYSTQSLPRLADTMSATVPDATEWSIDDVVQFFKDVGFIDQADVFREQEIDGRSLLLMRRSDVLTGLSLKLGPALKIYCHVQRLQKRCEQSL